MIHAWLAGQALQSAKASSALVLQPVTDPGLGHNMPWPLGIGLQLLAQLTYVDAQILDVAPGFKPPHLAKQMPVREDLAGMYYKLL